jgi:TM2 domain-containing membrane protein YozV
MAKAILPVAYNDPQLDKPLEIDLKQPWLAALLAWAFPGLGHLYQGRIGKGVLFFVCVFGTFLFGFLIGEEKVVYASSPGDEPWRWQLYCQLGVGLPVLPALVQRGRADMPPHPILGTLMQPPSKQPQPLIDASGNESTQPNELAAWTVAMHPRYELGTVYTVIAGLLNILVICDAYAGPLILGGKKEERDAKDDETPQGASLETAPAAPAGR